MNRIDIRWVDMPSGLVIDITAVRRYEDKRQNRHSDALVCKDRHHYEVDYPTLSIYSGWQVIQGGGVFPLCGGLFDSLPNKFHALIYIYILEEQYNSKALTRVRFYE